MKCPNCGEEIERESRISVPIATDLTIEEKYNTSYEYKPINSKILKEYVDSISEEKEIR